jgi:hypothetical protein
MELARSSGDALDTATVLRDSSIAVFQSSGVPTDITQRQGEKKAAEACYPLQQPGIESFSV